MSGQTALSAFEASGPSESGQATLSSFNSSNRDRKTVPLYKQPRWLRKQHWRHDRGIDEIASMTAVDANTILQWMREFGIGCRAKYTVEECVAGLERFVDEYGWNPTVAEYKQHSDTTYPGETTIRRVCGSWNDAKREAGLDILQEDRTQEECLIALERVANEMGKSPTTMEYEENRRETEPAWSAFNYVCGSWNRAKEMAGLQTIQKQNTEEECMDALSTVADKVEGPLSANTYTNNRSNGHPSRDTLQEKFGSWNEAKRMANLAVREIHDGDGISYPYGSTWQSTRTSVLERDGYACRHCGMTENEHYDEYGQGLDVHHIYKIRGFFQDFSDKELEMLSERNVTDTLRDRVEQRIAWANHKSNLVSICRGCHAGFEELPPETQVDKLDTQIPLVS